jgi:hypothetical protein
MRWLRLLLLILGWLLTPLVAWAACLMGAWVGTLVAYGLANPDTGVAVTAGAGAVTGFGALLFMMHLLRRSPWLRHSLHVTREGIPDAREFLAVADPVHHPKPPEQE